MHKLFCLLMLLLGSPAWAQLPAFPTPGPQVYFTSPPTGGWQQGGANINRFGDRLFLGDAYYSNTSNSPCGNDWFSLFQDTMLPTNGCGSYINYAVLSVLGGGDTQATQAQTGINSAVQSKHIPNAGAMISGVNAFVVLNSTSHDGNAWAFYAECHVLSGSGSQGCYGMEIDLRTMIGAAGNTDPFLQSVMVGHQIACGAGLAIGTGQTGSACGAAIQIIQNDQPWKGGVIFHQGSIAFGSAGVINAIAMPTTYQIAWYSAAGNRSGAVYVGSGGNLNLEAANFLVFNGNQGATCAGPTTGSFSAIGGLVIHC